MTFTLLFVSTKLPTQSSIRLVMTANPTPLPSGDMVTKFGAFVVMTSSVSVGQLTVIVEADNPTPSKAI